MCEFTKAVQKHREGVILYLIISPGADFAVFPSAYNSWRKQIEMKVCSPARDNKANREIINLVSSFFNTPQYNISIISGEKSREKVVLVKNISFEIIKKKLKESFNGL